MKKIYTLFKSKMLPVFLISALLGFNSVAVAQQPICGPIVENFNGGSPAGFTGDFIHGTVGLNGHLVKTNVIASGIYTVTTPTYQLANNASFVGFGFLLSGTERVARVEVAIIYLSTLSNQVTTVFLSQFVPTYDLSVPPMADVCRAVALTDLPGFPTGGRYRFRIELTPNTGNGLLAQNLIFDDFRTNGTVAQAPLPVNFVGFEAKKINSQVQLNWKVAGEENVARYEVERSNDGRNFITVATVTPNSRDNYSYIDAGTSATIYYRIKNVDRDGKFRFSTIARLVNGKSDIVIRAFPQPVRSQVTVQHPATNGKAVISISSADGRLLRTVTVANGTMQTNVDMATLQAGIYVIKYDDASGNTQNLKLVKQ